LEQTVRGPAKPGWITTSLALLASVLGGGVLLSCAQGDAGEAWEGPTVAVLVRPVGMIDRQSSFDVSGEVEARRSVNLGFEVPGTVVRVLVEEGQSVQPGQALAELDDVTYRLNLGLAEAQADLARDAHARAEQLLAAQGLPPADFFRAEVALRQAALQVDLARKQVADTRLIASSAGIVARRGVNEGEQVGPGVPVFTVVTIDPAQVRVGVPAADITSVRVGQAVSLRFPSLPNTVFDGRIELVGVVADPISRTYSVKIGLPNPAGALRPGMIAEASIRKESRVSMTTVPGEAVIPDPERAGGVLVFVYEPGEERVYSRRIRVGTVMGQEVEVLGGLDGNELVVVGGQHRVRDGSRVEATQAPVTDTAQSGAP